MKMLDDSSHEKNPAAVSLGRRGGKKGGIARAEALSPERRKEIASEAAKARWSRPQKQKSEKQLAYEAVLADMKERRAVIDQLIKNLEALINLDES